MRIAVNTRFLLKDKMEGFGWYTHEVFQRIVNQHPEHEFIFIFDRPYAPDFVYAKNVIPVKTTLPARHPVLFDWHFNRAIPKILKKYKADVFVSPDGYLSLTTDIPQIAVIHDLNFEHYKEDLKPSIIRYYTTRFPKFAKKAKHILTVSNYSKEDIAKTYSISPDKITVAHNGADEAFVKSSNEEIAAFRAQHGTGENYFLAVGSIHPRKNIQRLLLAFDQYKKKGSTDRLVLVGNKYHWTDAMKKTLEGLSSKNDILFTGHLTKKDLIVAYSGAKALLFPSYFEGFGIPIVEAMRCECPVICARATSFPEVAGNAALYFDPFDVNAIANAMEEFDSNTNLRQTLIASGKTHVQQFTWQKTANIVWETIAKTVHA